MEGNDREKTGLTPGAGVSDDASPAEGGGQGSVPVTAPQGEPSATGSAQAGARPARQNFAARMGDAGYVAGRRYDAVKNAFLRYKPASKKVRPLRARITRGGETFGCGRKVIAKLCLVGGYLRLYLALDPSAYNAQKYHHKDYSGVARYAKLPFMIKLSSGRQERYAVELIDDLLRANGYVPDENYTPSDQAGVFQPKRRRARVVYVDRAVPVPAAVPFPPLGEETACEDACEDEAPAEEALREEAEACIPAAVDVKLPVRAAVTDREGKRIGKVRRSVWEDADGNRVGHFEKDETNVFYLDAGGVRRGYVDGNDNVLTFSDGYVATLRRFCCLLPLVIFIIVALLAVSTGLLCAYLLERSGGPEAYAPVIFVTGEDGVEWSESEDIPVFMNEVFGDTVIMPGQDGSYRFTFENKNAHTVEYGFAFSETNEYGIELVYRLKRDGVYINGADGYVGTEALGVDGMTIEPHSASVFEIEWHWQHNDAADTAAGEAGASYTLHIGFTAFVQGT